MGRKYRSHTMIIIFFLAVLVPVLGASAVLSPSVGLTVVGPDDDPKFYDSFLTFPIDTDKVSNLNDNDDTTGIFSENNNDIQTFFVGIPFQDDAPVTSVTLSVKHQKGGEFTGQTRFSFALYDTVSQEDWFGDTIISSNGFKTDTVVLDENPVTELPWTVDDLKTMTFGFIQDTANKPINFVKFDVQFDVDDEGGPFFDSATPLGVDVTSVLPEPNESLAVANAFCNTQDLNGFFTTVLNPDAIENCIPTPLVGSDTSITVTVTDSCIINDVAEECTEFTLGTTILEWEVCDFLACNTITQIINNPDIEDPVVTANGVSQTLEVGIDSYTELGASATDNDPAFVDNTVVGGDPVVNLVGVYVVTYTATDAAGNIASTSITVTVVDTTDPVVTSAASSQTLEVGIDSYTELGASATDNDPAFVDNTVVGGDPVVNLIGVYVVTYTATDAAGNIASTSITVTVVDTTPPTIQNIPANRTEEAVDANGSPTTFDTVFATDNDPAFVDNTLCDAVSESTLFPIAPSFVSEVTTVTCTVSDDSLNESSGMFDVTVEDTTAPDTPVTTHTHSEFIEATSAAGANFVYSADSFDKVGVAQLICDVTSTNDPDGSAVATSSTFQTVTGLGFMTLAGGNAVVFPGGQTFEFFDLISETHRVSCIATDTAGNASESVFLVTVEDTISPEISIIPTIVDDVTPILVHGVDTTATPDTPQLGVTTFVVEGDDSLGTLISFDAQATDAVSVGSFVCTADTEVVFDGDSLATPGPGNVQTTANVNSVDQQFTISNRISETHTVTCTASDTAVGATRGTSSVSSSFIVTIQDTIIPIITLITAEPFDPSPQPPTPSIRLVQSDGGGCPAFDDPGATVSDFVDENVALEILDEVNMCSVRGSIDNSVTFTATDAAGNNADTVIRTVNVIDYFFTTKNVDFASAAFLVIENLDLIGGSPQTITLTSKADPTNTLDVILIEESSGVWVSDGIIFSSVQDPFVQTLIIVKDDTAFASYIPFIDQKSIRINDPSVATSAFGGVQPSSDDPIRFFESDVYYYNQGAIIKINDADISQSVQEVKVNLVVGDPDDPNSRLILREFTATRTPGTDTFSTGPQKITFKKTLPDPDNPPEFEVEVPVGGSNRIQVSYDIIASASSKASNNAKSIKSTAGSSGGFIAVAHVIDNPNSAVIPSLVSVDATAKAVCADGGDLDSDAICDVWESCELVAGAAVCSGYEGLRIVVETCDNSDPPICVDNIYELPCDVDATYDSDPTGATVCPDKNVKDLYVEIDYMQFHKPSGIAINNVVETFRNSNAFGVAGIAGINLHVIVDDEIPHKDKLKLINEGATDPLDFGFLQLKPSFFGTESERLAEEAEKLLVAKRQSFLYGMFIHSQFDQPLSSGYGEEPGNDFMVSLGEFTGRVGSVDQQGATLLHELGHNLGLRHGGGGDGAGQGGVNCKPNYLSVMNYLYQFDVADGGFVTRDLDFSRDAFSTVRELKLEDNDPFDSINGPDENNPDAIFIGGWDPSGGGSVVLPYFANTFETIVDWNGNNIEDTAEHAVSIHYFDDISECNTEDSKVALNRLESFKDWTALSFNIRDSDKFSSGIITINQDDTVPLSTEGIVDPFTVQPIVDAGDPDTIFEGGFYEQDITITDPHSPTWNVTIDYADGTTPDNFPELDSSTVIADHRYTDNPPKQPTGFYTVTASVYNIHCAAFSNPPECTVTDTLEVIVLNVAPEVSGGTSTGESDEGNPMEFDAAIFIDPGDDTWTASVDYGDGTTPADPVVVLNNTSFEIPDHIYDDGGDFTVTVTVTDDDGGIGSVSSFVTVNSVPPPVVSAIDLGPITLNSIIASGTEVATFTYLGQDTFTATIDWGDDTPLDTATVIQGGGTGSVSSLTDHLYDTVGPVSGNWTVTVTVTDITDATSFGDDTLLAHVVYVTDGVTDISSPIDNSEYKKGRTIPVNFIVTDANGNIVQTTWAFPEITLFQAGQDPVTANCGNNSPEAEFITGVSPHYQCTLKTNQLTADLDLTISIHLDDGLDPADFSLDREVTLFIK